MSSPIRGSDVFLKTDLEAILQGLWLVNEAAMQFGPTDPAYRAGFVAAMMGFATALNCTVNVPWQDRVKI